MKYAQHGYAAALCITLVLFKNRDLLDIKRFSQQSYSQ